MFGDLVVHEGWGGGGGKRGDTWKEMMMLMGLFMEGDDGVDGVIPQQEVPGITPRGVALLRCYRGGGGGGALVSELMCGNQLYPEREAGSLSKCHEPSGHVNDRLGIKGGDHRASCIFASKSRCLAPRLLNAI